MTIRKKGGYMQLLTFYMNRIKFGIPLSNVESIENRLEIVSVPRSLEYIQGVINLHGDVVPVYNLAAKFRYTNLDIRNIIIVNVEGMKVGLEVENVSEILSGQDCQVVPMPELMNPGNSCFNDVASCKKELIVLLDVSRLMSKEEQQGIRKLVEENS